MSETKQPPSFQLWIDADAIPRILREFIFKVSDRHLLNTTFVANQPLGITPSTRIKSIQVTAGADRADQEIVERMNAGDIVVTQDIPLAAQVIEKGGTAIHPRGDVYNKDNIRARLHLRDYMEVLRGAGVQTGGPPPMSEREKKAFADSLEKVIHQHKRKFPS